LLHRNIGLIFGGREGATRALPGTFQKEAIVVQNYVHTEFLPLEERIRRAGAERSVELGYRIGDTLARVAAAVRRLVASQHPAPSIGDHRMAAGD
jgi:hypothetical protein